MPRATASVVTLGAWAAHRSLAGGAFRNMGIVITLAVVAGFGLLMASGAWRMAFWPIRLRPAAMTAERLGFCVAEPADLERVEGICRAFAGGFNAMIAGRRSDRWMEHNDSLASYYRPFADEGAAMGYTLRQLGRRAERGFEQDVVRQRPQYCYLHYVGLGFWHAMRGVPAQRLSARIAQLDPLHGPLCWDGYGFKFGFFDLGKDSRAADHFTELPGYAARVAYQGLGRSLWFRHMDEPDRLVDYVTSLGPFSQDAASGVGLATVFTMIDRSTRSSAVLRAMPNAWRTDVMVGMCFAYKARSINDPGQFGAWLDTYDPDRRTAIRAGVAACDVFERQIRAGGKPEPYRRWREMLTGWLDENIEYPFSATRELVPLRSQGAFAAV